VGKGVFGATSRKGFKTWSETFIERPREGEDVQGTQGGVKSWNFFKRGEAKEWVATIPL